jgi:hypothetical protein
MTMTTTICHNPACHSPVRHADAYLRSVSLTQVAFCSEGCVAMFDQLDKGARRPIPEQRRPAGRVRR